MEGNYELFTTSYTYDKGRRHTIQPRAPLRHNGFKTIGTKPGGRGIQLTDR